MLKNTTIKARLAFVLILLSALMLAIGLMGVVNLSNANASLKSVYQDRLVAVGQLDQVIRAGDRMQLAIAMAGSDDPARLPALLANVERERVNTQRVWADYIGSARNPDERVLIGQFDEARKRFFVDALKPAIEAARSQDLQQLIALTHGKLPERYEAVSIALDRLIKLQIDVARSQFEQSQRSHDLMRVVAFAALALGLCAAAVIGFWLTRSITAPLNFAVRVAQDIAGGDLTRRVEVTSTNETGKLLQAMKDMSASLVRVVGEVRAGTDTIATASTQIAAGNLDLSSRTEQQAGSLEETAASMEELTSTVRQNSDNARQANQLAISASEEAVKGGAVVADVIATMGSINASARKIVDIISVIDGIAFQTNILALNAAVEAARAGEQGRGFAVVASEVRNLAQRSAGAAKEIKALINDSVAQVDAGSRLVDEAGATMNQVVSSAQRVSDIIGEILSASEEQTSGIDQVSEAITAMDEMTQQNAALVEEAAAAAGSLETQAAKLLEVVGKFKIDAIQAGRGESAPAIAVKPIAAVVAMRKRQRGQLAASARPPSEWEQA